LWGTDGVGDRWWIAVAFLAPAVFASFICVILAVAFGLTMLCRALAGFVLMRAGLGTGLETAVVASFKTG